MKSTIINISKINFQYNFWKIELKILPIKTHKLKCEKK